MSGVPRRRLISLASGLIPMWMTTGNSDFSLGGGVSNSANPDQTDSAFPRQPLDLVREMVLVSHFDLKRVREMTELHPALARAAWDWGFGDWETALGAASHMGNRGIAEYLIEKGARPSLFSAAMLGQLDVVKAFIAAQPGVQRIRGPHSISLLSHARAGGQTASAVYDFLLSVAGADSDPEPTLDENVRASLLGTYTYGTAPGEQIAVTIEHNRFRNTDELTWTRSGMMGRPLYHLGNKVFYPAGAAAVRIQFVARNGTTEMTVTDGDFKLSASRQ